MRGEGEYKNRRRQEQKTARSKVRSGRSKSNQPVQIKTKSQDDQQTEQTQRKQEEPFKNLEERKDTERQHDQDEGKVPGKVA